MTRFHLSTSIFIIPAALCVTACELPTKLGDLPLGTVSDSGDASGYATGDVTGDATGDAGGEETTGGDAEETTGGPVCGEGGAAGELAWSHERDEVPGAMQGVAVAPDGDVIAVGFTDDASPSDDAFVRRYAPDGALKWSQVYDGAAGLRDTPAGVAVDAAGFVHVLVREMKQETDLPAEDRRMVVLRHAPDGAQVWRWEHATLPFDTGGDYDPSGAIAVVGDRVVVIESEKGAPALRLELDAAGQLVSEVELAVPAGGLVDELAVGADGSALLAGEFTAMGETQAMWVGRFTPAGALAWSDQIGAHLDVPERLLDDGAGGSYLAWSTAVDGMTFEHRLRRYAADGSVTWSVSLPTTAQPFFVSDGVVRCDGTLLLTGALDLPATADWDQPEDLWIGRVAADGTLLWQLDQVFGPPLGLTRGVRIAATPEGDAVIAGLLRDDPPAIRPWLARFGGG